MFQIQPLLKYKNLFHAFSTVGEGNMANAILEKHINFEKVLKNRKRFLEKIDVPVNKTVCMWIQGKDSFQTAELKDAGVSILDYKKAVKTDGLITDKKELYLFLLIADCTPVIIFDPKKQVVALVHSGWKGTDLEIVKKVVKYLERKYKCKASNLIVGIGPSVSKESYLQEKPSQKKDARWLPFLKEVKQGKFGVDVSGFVISQLLQTGVLERNIYDCEIDTLNDKRFFSHYRDKNKTLENQGRFACVVGVI